MCEAFECLPHFQKKQILEWLYVASENVACWSAKLEMTEKPVHSVLMYLSCSYLPISMLFFLILKIIFFFTGCSLKLIVLSMLQSFLRPQYLVWCLSLCIVFLSFTKTEYVIIGSSPAQFKIDKPTSHNQDFTGKVKASFLLNIIASLIWQHSHCNVTGGVLYRIVE